MASVFFVPVQHGIRQGCALSPNLFSLYSEMIMRKFQDVNGCVFGDRNINNLKYAEDAVLFMSTKENLQGLLNKGRRGQDMQDPTLIGKNRVHGS